MLKCARDHKRYVLPLREGSEVNAPNNHFMKWRRWSEARPRAAVTLRLAQHTLRIRPNLSSIHAWPWNPNTRLISAELARHNEAKERKDSQAEWRAVWMLCLSPPLSRFFLIPSFACTSCVSAASRAPQRASGVVRKIRRDCIVMLSDCADAQFGAQICVIHQALISCPSSCDVFYGEKQSGANVQFVVARRREMTEVWWSWRAVPRRRLALALSLCRFRQVQWHLQNLISLPSCAKSSNNRRRHQVIILLTKCFFPCFLPVFQIYIKKQTKITWHPTHRVTAGAALYMTLYILYITALMLV